MSRHFCIVDTKCCISHGWIEIQIYIAVGCGVHWWHAQYTLARCVDSVYVHDIACI